MKRRVLAVAACCALTFAAQAQTPLPPPTSAVTAPPTASATEQPATPTPAISETSSATETIDAADPVEPLDLAVSADVLFPAGIAFQLSFREPSAGLRSITMTAEQHGWDGQAVNIDLADVTTDEDGLSTVSYLWAVAENPPLLFAPLTITWSVTPRSGVGETVETELIFADSRVTWAIVESGDIPVLLAVAESRTTAVAARAQLTLLSELMDAGGRQVPPLNVVLFPSGVTSDPCAGSDILVSSQTALETPCDFETASALYTAQGWDLAAMPNALALRTLITDKIIRAVYPSLFATEEVPRWFKAGLIDYLAGSFNINELETIRSASRNNSLLSSLEIAPSAADADKWRIQSVGMVVYMASRIGVVSMLDMLGRVDDGEALSDVWLDETGQAIQVLNVSWRNWIFSAVAEAAFNAPPSLAPTPTLVPTRTASLTPTATSSLTPTATWTNTPIPSITPTPTPSVASGFEQPTAAPTDTPTATLHPTITPRPPVAFALDNTPDDPVDPLNRPLIIAGVAAVTMVALSTLFLVFTRRHK